MQVPDFRCPQFQIRLAPFFHFEAFLFTHDHYIMDNRKSPALTGLFRRSESPVPLGTGDSACQKSFAAFAAFGRRKNEIIFCRGVYLAENTSRAASLAPQRCAERNRRRRLLARRLKLSPQATDEGKVCHYNPFKGNFRKLAPHPALRATFPRLSLIHI